MTIYEPLRNVDPWLSSLKVWSLPTPVDVLAWAAVQLLRAVTWVVVTPTLNVSTLGDLWPPVYWSAVGGLLWLAGWGSAGGAKTFAGGEDVSAFGARASWLGFAAGVIRLQVKAKAQAQAAAAVVGYGGAAALLAVGVLWWWLVPLAAAAVAVVWQTQVRQRWWIDERSM